MTQSAHFDRAHLEGARFQSADINDAFIRPATFDDATLKGLSRAKNKRNAHFSPEILERLRALDPEMKPPLDREMKPQGKEMRPAP